MPSMSHGLDGLRSPGLPRRTVGYDTDKGRSTMSEDAKAARQALQESMDLREQGHTED